MKGYESVETERRLDTTLPIYARIDGRGFSTFTRGLQRPFDGRMTAAMHEATRRLVDGTGARLGYTQSDEISLIWLLDAENEAAQMFFDGKLLKLASVLAGMATAAFTYPIASSHADPEWQAYAAKLPHFDARIFNLPSLEEGANAMLWREMDATRNAVSMAAHAHFSAKSLHKVSVNQMRERLHEAGVQFEAYPTSFKRGTYFRRVTEMRPLTEAERAKIPEKHRPAADHRVMRSTVRELDMPPLVTVTNRVGVVFHAEEPVTALAA